MSPLYGLHAVGVTIYFIMKSQIDFALYFQKHKECMFKNICDFIWEMLRCRHFKHFHISGCIRLSTLYSSMLLL